MAKIVVGLDGAHWELLDPWIQAGHLPTLKRIREGGVWGNLLSCLPPVTSPNWKCYSTGKNPGKLGVFWWEVVDRDARTVHTPESYEYLSPELWDYLNEEGIDTGVVNMPTSYPARDIDGVLIAGGPSTPEDGYATPATIEDTLEEQFDYTVHPRQILSDRHTVDQTTINAFLNVIDARFDVVEWLVGEQDYEFVHVTAFYINVLQHFLWDHEFTLKGWKLIDERLGRLLDNGHSLLLMSDHGSNKIEWEFRINSWLEREGYLVLNDRSTSLLQRLNVTREKAKSLLDAVPFGGRIKDNIPARITSRVPSNDGMLRRTAKSELVDWDNSRAIASGQGPIYLLGSKAEREQLQATLTNQLLSLKDPDGRPVFRDIHAGSELYDGALTERGPDIVLEQNAGYHLPGKIGGDTVFSQPTTWLGENKRTGLVAAYGEEIASSGQLTREHDIVDVMPSVLHWLGQPVPDDVDGTVITELFAKGSDPHERMPSTRLPLDCPWQTEQVSTSTVESRLEDLGYL